MEIKEDKMGFCFVLFLIMNLQVTMKEHYKML